MPAEWQRRTLDAPSQQPLAEVVVETPQPIEVDSVLINPHALDNYLLVSGLMSRKHGLVRQRESVIRSGSTIGCAVNERCACGTYPEGH